MPQTHIPPVPLALPEPDVRRERRIAAIEILAVLTIAVAAFLIALSFDRPLFGVGTAFLVIGIGALAFALAAQE